MGGNRLKIATVRGIPLYVSTSWIFIVGIVVWSGYVGLTQDAGVAPGDALILSLLATTLFFGSILAHEAAHAVMARSLDLPVTGITMVFWGGATETRSSGRGPLAEFLVAFVGPATTLLLAGVFWLLARSIHGMAADSVNYLSQISVKFAGLNALPGFPLDGGRMLLAAVWGLTKNRRTGMRAAGYAGMLVGGAIIFYAVGNFRHLQTLAIFLAYVGVIMLSTGRSMDSRVAFLEQLARGRAADAMRAPPMTVPTSMTLSQALDGFLRGSHGEAFPVVDAGRVVGMLSLASARKAGGRDPMRPVRDGMAPLTQTPVFAPDEALDEVVEWLAGRDGLVLADGVLIGAIGPRDVENWFRRSGNSEPRAKEDWVEPAGIPPRPDR